MAKLFLVGDFQSDNGPGMANKQIFKSLSKGHVVRYSKEGSKAGRIFEALGKIAVSDAVVICSKSQINYLVIKAARRLNKHVFYVMHGCSSFEARLNDPNVSDQVVRSLSDYDNYIVENSDKVICVSELFMHFMMDRMPDYQNKFDYIYNCIDIKKILSQVVPSAERKSQIISIGGGMKHKNILTVARAAQQLQPAISVAVVGAEGADSMDIKRQGNVKWIGLTPHKEVLKLLSESKYYIQNSTFETFGLAAVEALYCGCDLLISDHMGCKDLFENATDKDIIHNVNDPIEIKEKLQYLSSHGNNMRLREGFKKECVSHEWQLNKFNRIFEECNVR